MRKNKFLLSLIAATALSMSVIGCGSGSSNSGAIASTTDISVPANANTIAEQQKLHEYLILGQRSITTFTPSFGTGQSAPANAPGGVIAGSGDGVIDDARAQLYEIAGIAEKPLPNARIEGSGGTISTPTVTTGTTGYHSVEVDPSGNYVIGLSRARDRAAANDDKTATTQTQLQIFKLDFSQPIDVAFPPNIKFGPVAAVVNTIIFNSDATHPVSQGKFVSGVWGPSGTQYYASIQSSVYVFTVSLATGELTLSQTVTFPAGAANTNNNAVKMLISKDGKFLYALDQTNNNIVRWDRDLTTGQLSNVANIGTVTDPRGFAIDRTGAFMYVAGRSSGLLAAYKIGTDGSLTPVEVFTGSTAVPVTLPGAPALGDVAFNPQTDQLYVATYAGVLQGYNLNTTTGAISAAGAAGNLLGTSRNTTNIEVEPTGRFVFAVQENDLEEFQTFITTGPYPENPIFANIDSATNTGTGVYSTTAMQDSNGRTVYALPAALGQEFKGDLQVFRVNADGSVSVANAATAADNPYGLSFFTRVITPPASTT